MADIYNIGASTTQITLEATISTFGLAATTVNLIDVAAGTIIQLPINDDGNGNILPKQNIGDHTLLTGKRLQIFTKVTLTGDDAPTRANNAAATTGSYTIDGGDDGVKAYTDADTTYIDPNVFVEQLIDMQ